jgi:hypothetical protein
MDDATFRREELRAKTRAVVEPQHANYWRGYREGLRRAWHGTRIGSEAEHRFWLTFAGARDPASAARGAGYRDGFAVDTRGSEGPGR